MGLYDLLRQFFGPFKSPAGDPPGQPVSAASFFGQVWPPRNPPPIAVPTEDGRTVALRQLRTYVANLTFFRPGNTGARPIPVRIPEDHFHIEWPERIEDMIMPCIAVVESNGPYLSIGLGPSYIDPRSEDVYAPGTVVQWQAEYREKINLEIWTEEKSQRRAILAGLETAFSPAEQISGVRFLMPGFFGQLVTFDLNARRIIDDKDSAIRRRRAQVEMGMRLTTVRLVNKVTLRPVTSAVVGFPGEVDLSLDENATVLPP